ncbi:alpha/beta fold hydrolase [Thalassotalea sp. PLHSN55]|uniref:alpha/beta fold hydrolase n=1 Tax=Thalassotalea sp. PLHSN55 TaxID=3435888 RepID=UPI003F877C4D
MHFQSHFVSLSHSCQLHLMLINKTPAHQGIPILMIHGMIEDGRIFYHKNGKGLACYLAKQGYSVYVADLRGIGQSKPRINKNSAHGQTETIVNDIPALIAYTLAHSHHDKLHLVAHSWGGVYLNACLLRFPKICQQVYSGVYFGSKRQVRVKNVERFFKIDLFWNKLGFAISKRRGYFPAKGLKVGADNETQKTHQQCIQWIKKDDWQDSDDRFDYHQAAKTAKLPPIFYLAAVNDHSLGHQSDVKLFMKESGGQDNKYSLLSIKQGNLVDYDHLNMLTSPQAINDHFPAVLKWLCTHQHS